MIDGTILSLRGLTREFGTFRAVDGVTLDIRRGSITGLIGPNGAGKTTLFAMVAGALRPTAGRVLLDGADITGLPPEALFARGMARIFQIPRPFRRMSVLENLLVVPPAQTGETVAGALFRRAATRAEEARLRDKAMAILDFMTIAHLADTPRARSRAGRPSFWNSPVR